MQPFPRSPFVQKLEQEDSRSQHLGFWSGLGLAVAGVVIVIAGYWFVRSLDALHSATLFKLEGVVALIVVAWFVRRQARIEGMSVGEYLCNACCYHGRTGWNG